MRRLLSLERSLIELDLFHEQLMRLDELLHLGTEEHHLLIDLAFNEHLLLVKVPSLGDVTLPALDALILNALCPTKHLVEYFTQFLLSEEVLNWVFNFFIQP